MFPSDKNDTTNPNPNLTTKPKILAILCFAFAACGPKTISPSTEGAQGGIIQPAAPDAISAATTSLAQSKLLAKWDFQSPPTCVEPIGMVLGPPGGEQPKVIFYHCAHQQAPLKCEACHHKGSGYSSCGSGKACHMSNTTAVPSIKDAFHSNCLPCHGGNSGDNGCPFCHKA